MHEAPRQSGPHSFASDELAELLCFAGGSHRNSTRLFHMLEPKESNRQDSVLEFATQQLHVSHQLALAEAFAQQSSTDEVPAVATSDDFAR